MPVRQAMPWTAERSLPCAAGSVLLWHASLIHWGSACDAGEPEPRKSIAFTLKRDDAGVGGSQAGGAANAAAAGGVHVGARVSRAQLERGLDMRERLRLVVHTLLIHEHWHPGFAGLDAWTERSPPSRFDAVPRSGRGARA